MTERLADRNMRAEKLIRAINVAQQLGAEDEYWLPLIRDERAVVKRRKRIKLQYWAEGFIR